MFFNQGINAQDRDTLPAFITYSYIPVLKWNVTSGDHLFYPKGHMFYRELYLDYTFNQNALSSIEGNFGIKRIGLRMGVSVNMDNNLIGKVSKYGGYLGFKALASAATEYFRLRKLDGRRENNHLPIHR